MTRPNGSWVLLSITLIQIFGLYTLLIGLVGEKKSDKEVTPIPRRIYNELFPSDDNNEPGTGTYTFPKEMAQSVYSTFQDTFQSNVRYKGSVTQIVLLVVDAMRVDFLSKDKMPFVSSLLDESFGCVYVSRVKAPTVTLPRIKAIVTGDVSTYWDIIQNFKSQKITQDNILWHARQDFKKRIVFYGDDTWLKLFPNEFDRFEGVSSFFVSDFNQVDLNVTKRLDEEIKSWKPWDMLILHYLGLDHIGHVHGPNSGLIPPKLLEMDGVVKKIYEFISNNGPHSMVILCGDHGMANVGGHGGNSYPEVTTPLIFLSTRELTKCYNKDWRRLRDIPTVEQIDMAPTISALWGMMFPSQSAGKIIPNLLSYLPSSRQLFALYYNALHLRKFIKPDDKSLQTEYSRVVGRHILYVNNKTSDSRFASREESDLIESYTKLLRLLSESASGTVGTQNLALFGTGTALCLQAILIAFTTWKYQFQLWDFLLIPAIGLLVYFTESPGANTLLFLNAYLVSFKFGIKLPEMKNEFLNYVNYLILPIFYFSSSCVEEEHLIRYYLWATSLFSLCILQTPPDEPRHTYASSAAVPDPHEHPIVPITIPKSNRPAKVAAALVLHRVAISWNQTGQKWTDLNDLVDLLKEYNLLVFVVPLSLCFLYRLRFDRCHFFHAFTLLIIWLIKVDTGIVRYLSFNFFENEPQFAYILIALDLCISLKLDYSLKTSVLNFWILFSLLIHRHENLPLISIILHQVRIVSKIFQEFLPIKDSSNWPKRHIYILWFSFAAFYYQGNSNNIASIDVNAGYTGLSSYHEVLVGVLIFCNTFSAPMLIFLAFIEEKSYEDLLGHYRTREKYLTLSFLNILTKTNSTTIGIYCLVLWIFRHHLFIWTVFTPKLLYVISFSVFYAIVILIYGMYREIKAIIYMLPATAAN